MMIHRCLICRRLLFGAQREKSYCSPVCVAVALAKAKSGHERLVFLSNAGPEIRAAFEAYQQEMDRKWKEFRTEIAATHARKPYAAR